MTLRDKILLFVFLLRGSPHPPTHTQTDRPCSAIHGVSDEWTEWLYTLTVWVCDSFALNHVVNELLVAGVTAIIRLVCLWSWSIENADHSYGWLVNLKAVYIKENIIFLKADLWQKRNLKASLWPGSQQKIARYVYRVGQLTTPITATDDGKFEGLSTLTKILSFCDGSGSWKSCYGR